MPFPRFLRSMAATGGSPPTPAGAAGGGRTTPTRLALTMRKQMQSDWCWAAVTEGVSGFYGAPGSWTQCSIADAALGRQDCCTTGASDPNRCNRQHYLDVALDVVGHFGRVEPRRLTFPEIVNEIQSRRPLCCRIEWGDRNGHFLCVIDGFLGPSGDAYLRISDPIFLEADISFRDFASAYQTGASWTHTYFTTGSALGGAAMVARQPRQPQYSDAIGA